MIDEKKIEEAAEDIYEEQFSGYHQYFVSEDDHSPLFEEHDIRCAVTLGIKWAQQEFVKSLWHDASEEPKKFIQIVIEIKNEKFTECIALRRTDDYMYNWEYSCQVLDISRWFYLSDILPKEGGEK